MELTREEKVALNHRNLGSKRRIVLSGCSRIFENWKEATHGKLTADTFLEGLEWLSEDPLDEKGRTTRELGLEGDGSTAHLIRCFEGPEEVVSYRYAEDYDSKRRKGYLWLGSKFTWEASPEERAFWGTGTCYQLSKISINAADRI